MLECVFDENRAKGMSSVTLPKIALLALTLLIHDGAHDDWFNSLKVPGAPAFDGSARSCCDMKDCKTVKARHGRDGQWEAWVDSATFPDDPIATTEGHAPNAWVKVPSDAILHRDNPTGEAVLCWYQGVVRCFVPGVEV